MRQKFASLVFLCFFALSSFGVTIVAQADADTLNTLSFNELEQLVKENTGKVIIINFFATFCEPCRDEMPILKKIRAQYGEDKVFLLGASLDEDVQKLQQFLRQAGINYPVVRPQNDLIAQVGLSGIPHFLIFDVKGKVLANQPGFLDEAVLRRVIDTQLR